MSFLALKLISRTVPGFIPRYECRRGISFLRNLFRRTVIIRKPLGFRVEDYKCFYFMPLISIFSSSVKRKYLSYSIVVVSLSVMTYFYIQGRLEYEFYSKLALLGLTILMVSRWSAYVGTNLIGRMYLHKNKKEIIISYANKNGKRCFKSCTLDDIKIVDHPSILHGIYLKKVILKKSGQNLKLMTRGARGNILMFELLFPNVII